MNEDQMYDAAEREMDLYRAEITRITGQRDDLRKQLDEARAELATLRELDRIAGHFGETWDELMASLPDSYGCEMNCAEANAAADLYRALDRAGTAKAIIAAHAEHDDDEERASHREDGDPRDAGLPS